MDKPLDKNLVKKMRGSPPEKLADDLRGIANYYAATKTVVGGGICRLIATVAWCVENMKVKEMEEACVEFELKAMQQDNLAFDLNAPGEFAEFLKKVAKGKLEETDKEENEG